MKLSLGIKLNSKTIYENKIRLKSEIRLILETESGWKIRLGWKIKLELKIRLRLEIAVERVSPESGLPACCRFNTGSSLIHRPALSERPVNTSIRIPIIMTGPALLRFRCRDSHSLRRLHRYCLRPEEWRFLLRLRPSPSSTMYISSPYTYP